VLIHLKVRPEAFPTGLPMSVKMICFAMLRLINGKRSTPDETPAAAEVASAGQGFGIGNPEFAGARDYRFRLGPVRASSCSLRV
jgi:hypothetical protein